MAEDDETFDPKQRRRLVGIAYRLTGGRADAEDIVQDVLVHWLREDRSEVRSPQAYLTRATVNRSLNHLRKRRTRDYPGEWLPEPVSGDGFEEIERLEDISYAFIALLERLTPRERAVFVLRSAFDCSYTEIAAIVGSEEAACRKTFSRAKAAIVSGKPRATVDRDEHKRTLEAFLVAAAAGDIGVLSDLLKHDVEMHGDGGSFAPALKKPLVGVETVARFIIASRALLSGEARLSVEYLNGTAAGIFRAGDRVVLAILIETDGSRIARVFALANTEKLAGLA